MARTLRKKQYQLVNASYDPVVELDVDGHKIKLDKQGQAYVYDEGLGREIDARYGVHAKTGDVGKVVAIEVDDSDPAHELGHMHWFGLPSRLEEIKAKDRARKKKS